MDTVNKMIPFYAARAAGGALYLVGAIMMVWNLMKTAKAGNFLADEAAEAPALEKNYETTHKEHWHRWIERKPIQLMVVALVVVAIGGIIEFVPTFLVKSNIPTIASVKPYTPLELHGRDIYVREGCYTCHSQMVRPFRSEVARYAPNEGDGGYSKAGEFVYDHPFQWGSKRTGPDLARLGGKYPDSWHFFHMFEPTQTSDNSIMPRYPWLYTDQIDVSSTVAKIKAMQRLGVPYGDGYEKIAASDMELQANEITKNLMSDEKVKQFVAAEGIEKLNDREIIALIAYLQRLGKDIKVEMKTKAVANK